MIEVCEKEVDFKMYMDELILQSAKTVVNYCNSRELKGCCGCVLHSSCGGCVLNNVLINKRVFKKNTEDLKIMENNNVLLIGEIASGFTFSHEVFGEGFYRMEILVKRLSSITDTIPVMISDRLIDVKQNYQGEYIQIKGKFRSYNRQVTVDKIKVILYVFAKNAYFVKDTNINDANQILLRGYICKEPIYRKTPLGREIADLHIAVNRPYGKSDYIPCVAWGRDALYLSGLSIGTMINVRGRIQSRNYYKAEGGKRTLKTAYEVSIIETLEAKNKSEQTRSTCLITSEHCQGLELSHNVCISCDIGMDRMAEEEQMRCDGVCESDISGAVSIIKRIRKNQ